MKRFLLHIALWAAYAAVEIAANWPHFSNKQALVRETLFFLPVIALPFYAVAYWFVPHLLWRGRKTLFWLSCIAVFLLQAYLRLQWTHWFWVILGENDVFLPLSKISKNLFRDYAVIALGVCLKIIRDWDKKDRLTLQLQGEKRDAELQFLRAQIHPHFLFNTLNNLYGLALKNSPYTAESILKLSALLDFILYECSPERIPVEKEMALIGHYIELEKLRFDSRLQLRIHDATAEHPGGQIAPLLLLPFVENAFKHGAANANGAVFVKIDAYISENNLHFQVENSARGRTGHGAKNGIGLRNVEKRLELLYPGRFELYKRESDGAFLVALLVRGIFHAHVQNKI